MTLLLDLFDTFRRNRQCGHTTVAARIARETGAVFVVGSGRQAHQVQREHGVEAIPVERLDRLRGRDCPIIIDGRALDALAGEQSHLELERLKERVALLEYQVERGPRPKNTSKPWRRRRG